MLAATKMKIIQDLVAGATREELIWLNGYLAGLVAQNGENIPQLALGGSEIVSAPKPGVGKITIAYGTETGNAKKLATDLAARAKKKGINAKLVGLDQYRLGDLAREEYLFTVISTQGDGEPPAAAKKFYDHIHRGEGGKLDKLKFSVLALGDTSYPLFCKAGEDVDQQLQKLGAERIVALRKCDTDFEADAAHWFDEVIERLSSSSHTGANGGGGHAGGNGQGPGASVAVPLRKPGGKRTYAGTVLNNINLNDTGSDKRTHHLEIVAEDLDYQPGDALGLTPENSPASVEAIIALTGVEPSKVITYRNEEMTVANLLKKKLNIVYLPERVVRKYAALVQQEIPETRIGLLDLLKIYPVKNAAQFEEVIGLLEPIAPRLYSISSSPGAHAGEIHITVARDTFCVNGESKYGLCSDQLTQLSVDETFDFYIHRNAQFKLPAPNKDIIMIGPGTGIAPFRSFLAERDSTGAPGRNWLFFGDQHFTTDFLYQTEIQNWIQTGVLTKINVAFSRDQQDKVYVQHKMKSNGAEFFEWLEAGAHVYLCGAREPMSEDVEKALLDIIRRQGKKTEAQAAAYLEELREAGRYVKDVY
jgi:sulfite reductase (NADPH) flavoprotein alpha-component